MIARSLVFVDIVFPCSFCVAKIKCVCIEKMNSYLTIGSRDNKRPFTSRGNMMISDTSEALSRPTAVTQIRKFKATHPKAKLRFVTTKMGRLSLIQIPGRRGFKDLHASKSKKHDITVPELRATDGVFEGIDYDKAKELLQGLTGYLIDSDTSSKKAEDRLLKDVLTLRTADSEATLSLRLLMLHSHIGAALGFKFGIDIAVAAATSHALVSGLLAFPDSLTTLNRSAASFAASDGAYLTPDGNPWYVQELKHMPAGSNQSLTWKDLNTANIQDLHHLNGFPETRVSLTLCQSGFKFRFRIPQDDSNKFFNCYQFPEGDEFMKFGADKTHANNVMFLRLMASIVFKAALTKVPEPPVNAPPYVEDERPCSVLDNNMDSSSTQDDYVLINSQSNCQVSITSYRFESLPRNLRRSFLKQEALIREEERMRAFY